MARAHPRTARLALLALLSALTLVTSAHAQTLRFGVAAGPPPSAGVGGFGGSLRLENARVGTTRVTLGLAYDDAVQLDLGMQANDTFGPLGNVIGEAALAVRTDGQAQGALGVRGVLGPVALGVRLSGFTAAPERFDPLALAGATRPLFAAGGWGVELDASGRPARALIVQASPQLYLLPSGASWRANARLRWLRAIGPHELSLRLEGYLPPAVAGGDAAIGVGFTYHRRRAPDLDGALYLGYAESGLAPGGTVSLSQALGPVQALVGLDAEPYRRDVPPYRAHLDLSFEVGSGSASVRVAAASGPAGTSAVLALSYVLPVTLPGGPSTP